MSANNPQLKKSKKKIILIIVIILIIILIILLSRCSCFNTRNLTNTPTNKTNTNQITNNNLNTDLNNDLNTNTNINTNINGNQENPWPDLSGCINGIIVDYHSTAKVADEKDAADVFNEFISWAKKNNKEIFSGKGNNWQFQSAAPHGIYKNIKYWRITALWFSEIKQQWLPQIVFDVSENSQVVRLLGCL